MTPPKIGMSGCSGAHDGARQVAGYGHVDTDSSAQPKPKDPDSVRLALSKEFLHQDRYRDTGGVESSNIGISTRMLVIIKEYQAAMARARRFESPRIVLQDLGIWFLPTRQLRRELT